MRVLKPAGSIFVNLGDKYAQDTERSRNGEGARRTTQNGGLTGAKSYLGGTVQLRRRNNGVPRKSLMFLPERYRIACVDELGLIARAVIVWSKPNGLPESVTDRVRRSHEDWVHLTKQPRYFSAVDEIRETHTGGSHPSGKNATVQKWESGNGVRHRTGRSDPESFNPLGKMPGSVWEISSQPLTVPDHLGVDHFAAFPMEWPHRIILGWSPSGICVECGEGRRPVNESQITADRGGRQFNPTSGNIGVLGKERVYRITGEACACSDTSAPIRPSVVVDPFGGTGTTALVAKALGRHGISVDMSADYCQIARWRINDSGQLAKVLGVSKPPIEMNGQIGLFEVTP